ncbi:MAG TPA: hypothetical protein VGJ20_07840 [Xanthobacteraceae bacterium]|jgi:hypothetical protein
MNDSPSPAAAEKSVSAKSALGPETNNPTEQESSKPLAQMGYNAKQKIEGDAERIRSAVMRLTSSSIDELEGLTSELQKLQEFLESETGRVQREIESVLAGIKIIIETIAPWRNPRANHVPNARDRIKRWPPPPAE